MHARLCARLGKAFGARPHPATITYNAKASELAARQRLLFREKKNVDPQQMNLETEIVGRILTRHLNSSPWQCYSLCWRMRHEQKSSGDAKGGDKEGKGDCMNA
jgi:hypothetical protein